MIKVPYCLRVKEETKDLRKAGLQSSELVGTAPCAPGHAGDAGALLGALAPKGARELQPLRQDARLRRRKPARKSIPSAPAPCRNTSDAAGVDEGMDGISTRFAFKALVGDVQPRHQTKSPPIPVHLMYVLEQAIKREQFPDDTEKRLPASSSRPISPRAMRSSSVTRSRKPYLESYHDYGQNLFDRYVDYADAWIEDQDFKDPDTGQIAGSRPAQPGTVEDRKAGWHRQPEGLPQRSGQVHASRPRADHKRKATRAGPAMRKSAK